MLNPGVIKDKDVTPSKLIVTDHGKDSYLGITLDASAVDSGNTPTTTLRKGLVIAELDAGNYADYLDGQTDGREVAVGILVDQVDMLASAPDEVTPVDSLGRIIKHGVILADACVGLDLAAIADLPNIEFRGTLPTS